MTDKMREDFEAHISEIIVSEAGLDIALKRDEAGDYETSWVQNGWQFWQAATLKANEWRPIADAPRDGTPILVANNIAGGSWIAHYLPLNTHGCELRNPWHSLMLHTKWHKTPHATKVPTIWQPLPLPPTGTEGNHG